MQLWQDVSPVVHISHFLVSNVQSKFYRLLLDLDLLAFFFNQITKLNFFACCWWCGGVLCVSWHRHFFSTTHVGMLGKQISQSFRLQINCKNTFLTGIGYSHHRLKWRKLEKFCSWKTLAAINSVSMVLALERLWSKPLSFKNEPHNCSDTQMWITEPFRVEIGAKLNDLKRFAKKLNSQAEERSPNMDGGEQLLYDEWRQWLRFSVSLWQFVWCQWASHFSISIFTQTRAILKFKMAKFPPWWIFEDCL